MQQINDRVSKSITKYLLEEEYNQCEIRRCKIEYAITALMSEFEKFLVLAVVFGILGYLIPFLLCYLVLSMTRVYLGGFHMKSHMGCLLLSFVVVSLSILGDRLFHFSCSFSLMTMSVLNMVVFAPIPSEQRLVYSKKQKMIFKFKGCMGIILSGVLCWLLPQYDGYIISLLMLQVLETGLVVLLEKGGRR